MYGEDGDDILIVSGGDNELFGGAGNDILRSYEATTGDGDDDMFGGDGDDYIRSSAGNDDIYGGAGDDDMNGQ